VAAVGATADDAVVATTGATAACTAASGSGGATGGERGGVGFAALWIVGFAPTSVSAGAGLEAWVVIDVSAETEWACDPVDPTLAPPSNVGAGPAVVASATGVATTVIAPETLASLASAKAKGAVVEGVWVACPGAAWATDDADGAEAAGEAVAGATSVWAALEWAGTEGAAAEETAACAVAGAWPLVGGALIGRASFRLATAPISVVVDGAAAD
jgi:hypothetical protein